MISVLAHELTHIADGDNGFDCLVSGDWHRASDLTGQEIRHAPKNSPAISSALWLCARL